MIWRDSLRVWVWSLVALWGSLVAAAPIDLSPASPFVALGRPLQVHEDKAASLTIEAVSTQAVFSEQMLPLRAGESASATWLRMDFVNPTDDRLNRWLSVPSAQLQEASAFVRQEDGHWLRQDAGSGRPFKLWPVAASNPVFPFTVGPHSTQTVYLRARSNLPATIQPEVWEPMAFQAAQSHHRMIDGLMLGGLVMMVLVGVMMIAMFRERAFLFNLLATITYVFGVASSRGYGFMYLWPDAPSWNAYCLPVFALLGVGLNILFLRDLMEARHKYPRINKLLLTLLATQWLPVIGLAFGDFRLWSSAAYALNFPATAVLLLIGIYAMWHGNLAARYYTAAYAVLGLGSLSQLLTVLKQQSQGGMIDNGLPLAMLISNALMMASVIGRFVQLKREKAATQDELLAQRVAQEVRLEREVRERTAELNVALVETRKARSVQSRMVAFIGHDMRAPLATIVNYIRLLRRGNGADNLRHQNTIEQAALNQLELIEDLVEYARGDLDRLELVPVAVYLPDWLDSLTGQGELLASPQGNHFTLKLQGELVPVVCFDPKRLRQVLINLIGNAAKFTSHGEIVLKLCVEQLSALQIRLHFGVEDTGVGIEQQYIEQIFEPFERRQSGRAGHGLGLSIARQIVHSMGGQLKATSAPGNGSQFSFSVVVEPAVEADVVLPDTLSDYSEEFGDGKVALVADDNPASLEYIREVLISAGFDVVCVGNGQDAVNLAIAQHFDVVIVDQLMPIMTGWDVLQQLHAALTNETPPIILCSALQPQRPADLPLTLQFDASLLKPVNVDRLLQILKQLLNPELAVDRSSLPQIPQTRIAALRSMVSLGQISDIENWANLLEHDHPEYAEFAKAVFAAATNIDMTELERLASLD